MTTILQQGRVERAVSDLNPKMIAPCDVNLDESINSFFNETENTFKKIDFMIHSVAFAPLEDIRTPTSEISRAGFLTAMETSVYSFIATAKAAAKLMNQGGSLITISYFGAEKVVEGYNLMGIAKSALESSVRYLANDLGPKNIRVNAISAGAIKTLASSALGNFNKMLQINERVSPLRRNVSTAEVGKAAAYLASDLSSGTTGEILHVDSGYNILGTPVAELQNQS